MNKVFEITECFESAIKSLSSSKLRSFLTVLGVVIGIMAVTAISSIGNGLGNEMSESLEAFGMDRLEMYYYGNDENKKLDESDLLFVREHENVSTTIPSITRWVTMKKYLTEEEETFYLEATTHDYAKVLTDDILYGRFLLPNDIESASNVIVISDTLSENYFGYKNSVGETITIKDFEEVLDFVVIGVIDTQSKEVNEMFAGNSREYSYVPYTYYQETYDYYYFDSMLIGIKDTTKMDNMASEIDKMLRVKNDVPKDTYGIFNLAKEISSVKEVFGLVVLFVNVVASIALVVGSIGIMNIMLVTVTERTREIGIRKSLGATKGIIKLQFLMEAVILSQIGGVLGVTLGYLIARVASGPMGITPEFSISTILTSFIVCSIIGIVAGVYPASKASNLNPIDALRYE